MPLDLRTPGVYVEEISTLPASIAQVETAVPAFVGYTAQAINNGVSLNLVPTRISSLVEYEQYFGKAPSYTITEVKIDGNGLPTDVKMDAPFVMYDSLRMFFANGGGKCYIVSVAPFGPGVAVAKPPLENGINALVKYDEPTLILFPDAVALSAPDLAYLQKLSMAQCAKLQDRFTVCDVKETVGQSVLQNAAAFRQEIGMTNLKYAAAYTPNLKTSFSKEIHYRDISASLKRNGVAITLKTLTASLDAATKTSVEGKIDKLDLAVLDTNMLVKNPTKLSPDDWRKDYYTALDAFRTANSDLTFTALFNQMYEGALKVNGWLVSVQATGDLKTPLESIVDTSLKVTLTKVIAYDKAAKTATATAAIAFIAGTYKIGGAKQISHAKWGGIFTDPGVIVEDGSIFTGVTAGEKRLNAEPSITTQMEYIYNALVEIQTAAAKAESDAEFALVDGYPNYKIIRDFVSNGLVSLPPSGAVVGIYANVDSSRGVWKAPANESVNGVTGLTQIIDHDTQKELNVDATSGKSINAIRAFTGKGTLIWGARTLAGNDNEWRYVPVRRLFIMAEESIKKATEFVVFEPNDASTWVRTKSMITNFLLDLWKQGALAGAKPDHAFFVNVGLGETMTAQDVLEGKLIIEIGMAAVRPAEFIILRFSHKLQQS